MSDNQELDPEIAELLGVSQSQEDKSTSEIDISKAAGKIIPKTKLRTIDLQKVFADKTFISGNI